MRRRLPYPGAIALFDQPPEARVLPVSTPVSTGQVRWTPRFRPAKRIACDQCVLSLHENKGVGPMPLSARHRRQCGEEDLRLCTAHADALRIRDGLKKFGS